MTGIMIACLFKKQIFCAIHDGAKDRLRNVWACLLIFLISTPALRAADEPLIVETTVLKVTIDEAGTETLVEAPQAEPGDILVYRAIYRNTGGSTLRDLTAMMPVPPGLVYVPGSALPVAVEATRDGKVFFRLNENPLPVPVSAWRALRWAPRDISPGEEFSIELRARVASPRLGES